MNETIKFDLARAKSASTKITKCERQIENIQKTLSNALSEQSTSWWRGNSKNGYMKRVERLLNELKLASKEVAMIGNDLLEIARAKGVYEEELSAWLSPGKSIRPNR